jgi:hypothetical protein
LPMITDINYPQLVQRFENRGLLSMRDSRDELIDTLNAELREIRSEFKRLERKHYRMIWTRKNREEKKT